MMIPYETGFAGNGTTPSDTGGGFDINALVSTVGDIVGGIVDGVTGAQIAEDQAAAAASQAEATRIAALAGAVGGQGATNWTPIAIGVGVLGVAAYLLMR
jgi:hypothetical protein